LSPWLFARYIRDLLTAVAVSNVGCNIGGTFINILAYADDIVLIAPSWHGLQHLLDIVVQHSKAIDMSLNSQKSVLTLLYSNTQSLVGFSVIPKCVTLNDL